MARSRFNANAGKGNKCVNGWMIGIFVFFAIVIIFGIFFPRSKLTATTQIENYDPHADDDYKENGDDDDDHPTTMMTITMEIIK